jgi:hypothetical protein
MCVSVNTFSPQQRPQSALREFAARRRQITVHSGYNAPTGGAAAVSAARRAATSLGQRLQQRAGRWRRAAQRCCIARAA